MARFRTVTVADAKERTTTTMVINVDQVVSVELARYLTERSHDMNRQVGVIIDRPDFVTVP